MSDTPDPPGPHTRTYNNSDDGRYSPSKPVGLIAAMLATAQPTQPSTPSDDTPRGALKLLPELEPAQWESLATATDISQLHTTAVTTLSPSPGATEGDLALIHTTAPVSLTPTPKMTNDTLITNFHNAAAQAAQTAHIAQPVQSAQSAQTAQAVQAMLTTPVNFLNPDEIEFLHTTAHVSMTPSPAVQPSEINTFCTDAQVSLSPTPEATRESSVDTNVSALSYDSITESDAKLTEKPENITLPMPPMIPNLTVDAIMALQDKIQYNDSDVPPSPGGDTSPPWGWDDDPDSKESRILTLDDPLPTVTDPHTEHSFMQMIRMRSLPGDTLRGMRFPKPETTQELLEAATHFQRQLSDTAMGFGYYYPVPGFQMRQDSTMQATSDEVNASVMMTATLLDAGLSKDAINVTQRGLTNTSWFRLAHTLMGAIIRGAMRSPAFRKLGRNSLNHVADHHFSPPGGPRPLTHLQLMQAMAHQLSRICDTNPENEQYQPTNMYDTTLQHLAEQIHTVLKDQAREGITQEDRDAAKFRVLQELDKEYEAMLRQDPGTQGILETRALERITNSLAAESHAVTEDWRRLWEEGYKAAVLQEPFPGPNHVAPSTSLMQSIEGKAITTITDKLTELRDDFLRDVKRNILTNEQARIYGDAISIYNKQVNDQVKVIEQVLREDRQVEIEKRSAAVEARLNEEVERDFQNWKETELNKMKEAFMPGLEVAAHEHVLQLVRGAARRLGYELTSRSTEQWDPRHEVQGPANTTNNDVIMKTPETTEKNQMSPTKDPRKNGPPQEDDLIRALDKKADELVERKKKANQGLSASMHAPANQMAVEPEEAPTNQTGGTAPETKNIPPGPAATPTSDPILLMILDRIQTLTNTVGKVVERVQNVEQTVEGKQKPSPHQTTRTTQQNDGPQMAKNATPQKQEAAQETTKKPDKVWEEAFPPLGGGMAQAPGKGKGRAEPRQAKPKPTIMADGWVVTARANVVKDQSNVAAYANIVNRSMGRTAMGRQSKAAPKRNTTEITVVRNGGVNDEAAERAIRNQNPSAIVMAVRTAISKLTAQPIQVLGGRWASGFKAGRSRPTGNFVYTLNGVLNYDQIRPFEQELVKPFGRGVLTPTHGWVWAQLRNVPTSDAEGVVYGPDELTNEILKHPAFEGATLCMPARWHGSLSSIMDKVTATVLIAYIDETGEQTAQIQRTGVHMFGAPTPFHIVGDQARFTQCQRCHNLGHEAGAKECKLKPGAFRCYKCGGDHHTEQHDFHCKGKHATAGKCNCPAKCILCGKGGHHARSRSCPKRGEFGVAPPAPLTMTSNSEQDTDTPQSSTSTSLEPGLVPTQREEPKQKKTKTRKGKGKGKNQPSTQTSSANSFSALGEDDIPTARIDDTPILPRIDHMQEIADTLAAATTVQGVQRFEPRTDISIIPIGSLPGVTELDAAYVRELGNGAEATDEAELGWEGLMGDREEAYQPLARYALQQGWPLTRAATKARVVEGLEPYQTGEALITLDKKLGGDGSGRNITPAAYANDITDGKIFFAQYELPKTPEKALKEIEEGVIFTNQIITDYDVQLGGDGQGNNLWNAIPDALWDDFPKAVDIVRQYRTPPQSSTQSGMTIGIANTYSLQTWRAENRGGRAPGILNLHHIIRNYLEEFNWSAGMMSAEVARIIGDKHTPFKPIIKGRPGILHKHRDAIIALRAWNNKIIEEGL